MRGVTPRCRKSTRGLARPGSELLTGSASIARGVRLSTVETGFGPHRSPRAIVITFDNLGEASELERGTWDAGVELGRHPSVTEALPRLLDELDALGLVTTFSVEAIHCALYPEPLRR